MSVWLRRLTSAGDWGGPAHCYPDAGARVARCGQYRFSVDEVVEVDPEPAARCAECARLADDTWEGER